MRHFMIVAVALGGLVTATSTASADSAAKMHDGFHFQAQLGLGYYSTSADAAGLDQSISGVTFPGAILLGGTLMKGLVLGGGLVVDYAPSPTFEQNGVEVSGADISQFSPAAGERVEGGSDRRDRHLARSGAVALGRSGRGGPRADPAVWLRG